MATGALPRMEEPVDVEESQKEIQAIGDLILALGGRESNSPGKVWSSPSEVPAALGPSPPAAVVSPPAPAPYSEAGCGPVLGRAAAQEGEGPGRRQRPSLRPCRRAVVARAPSPQSRLTWHGPP